MRVDHPDRRDARIRRLQLRNPMMKKKDMFFERSLGHSTEIMRNLPSDLPRWMDVRMALAWMILYGYDKQNDDSRELEDLLAQKLQELLTKLEWPNAVRARLIDHFFQFDTRRQRRMGGRAIPIRRKKREPTVEDVIGEALDFLCR